ncbi:MAG: MFS transporter [Lentisphaeria bacterium]|nr:MFS transporter [Lentisphaeria bacterium]
MAKREWKHYQVSGLDYTMPKLLATMAIIACGSLAMTLCVGMVPRIVPLKLKEIGVSSTLMVFIMSTMGQILNMTVCPWVSFKSDRYRSKRWGRRIPFILYTLPFLCLSWAVLALYEFEAELLHKILAPLADIPQGALAVIVLAAGVVLFKFFYMFVGSVYHYIPNDVIPPQFLTRFYGALSILTSGAVAFFNYFFFEYILSHFSMMLWATIIFYTVAMGFMCLALKEPRFPEPSAEEKRSSKGFKAIFTFMKESFSHPIYWYEFATTACTSIVGAAAIFVVFFEQSMGLTLAEIGKKAGISSMCVMIVGFGIASLGTYLIDRWHPVRVSVFLLLFGIISFFYDCKWFFFKPETQVFWWSSLLVGQVTFLLRFRGPAGMPTLMRLLPKSRFGQFCSARSICGSLVGMIFALLLGVLMDFLKSDKGLGMGEDAYRIVYLWQTAAYVGMVFCYMKVYQYYCKLGGYGGYRAPASWEPSGYEKMEISTPVETSPFWCRMAIYGIDFALLATVAINIFWSFYAKKLNLASESRLYMTLALPVSVAAFVYYLTIRTRIMLNIRRRIRGENAFVPHHGILFLSMMVRVLLSGALGIQAFLALKGGSTGVAAKMSAFESVVDMVYVTMIIIFFKMDKLGVATCSNAVAAPSDTVNN